MSSHPPIRIPFKQRVRLFRVKVLPVLVFMIAVIGVSLLWNREITPAGMVGEVYGLSSELTAPLAGTLERVEVEPFSRVTAGDLIGYIRTEPVEKLHAAIAVLRAEIDLARLGGLDPVLDQQRNLTNWVGLQQDLIAARAELASLSVQTAQARREYERFRGLAQQNHVSEIELDRLRSTFESLEAETQGVEEKVAALQTALRLAPHPESIPETLRATLAWQERRLEQIEAEFAPIAVRAPTSGVIVHLHRKSGEFVVSGSVIAVVRSETPEFIIGYMKPPILLDPHPGMEVEIIPRSERTQRVRSEIMEVGTQFEALGPVFHGPFSAEEERALPMKIRIPPGLQLRPGELVDLRIISGRS